MAVFVPCDHDLAKGPLAKLSKKKILSENMDLRYQPNKDLNFYIEEIKAKFTDPEGYKFVDIIKQKYCPEQ